MPGVGVDAADQSLATQMQDVHPGCSPKPGSFDRHVAGLAQQLALPDRDNCRALNATHPPVSSTAIAVGDVLIPKGISSCT